MNIGVRIESVKWKHDDDWNRPIPVAKLKLNSAINDVMDVLETWEDSDASVQAEFIDPGSGEVAGYRASIDSMPIKRGTDQFLQPVLKLNLFPNLESAQTLLQIWHRAAGQVTLSMQPIQSEIEFETDNDLQTTVKSKGG